MKKSKHKDPIQDLRKAFSTNPQGTPQLTIKKLKELHEKAKKYQGIATVYFEHIYQTNSFDLFSLEIETKKNHACLRYGYWCWKNALENPSMAIEYLLRKMKHA